MSITQIRSPKGRNPNRTVFLAITCVEMCLSSEENTERPAPGPRRRCPFASILPPAFQSPNLRCMQFGICNEIFEGWSLPDTFRFARKVGYDAVEIAPFTIANYVTDIPAATRKQSREDAARAGIAISGIHWVLVQAEGMYVNHVDSAVRQRTPRYFGDLVDFCSDLGGSIIVVGSPKQRNVMAGVELVQAWAWATETFRDAVKDAEDKGITICFEPLAPTETNFINT